MRMIIKPTNRAATASRKIQPIKLPPIPSATTSDEAASERACQALLASRLERTFRASAIR